MSKLRPVRAGRKKPEGTRARQVGCIVWLVVALVFVLYLFYALLRHQS